MAAALAAPAAAPPPPCAARPLPAATSASAVGLLGCESNGSLRRRRHRGRDSGSEEALLRRRPRGPAAATAAARALAAVALLVAAAGGGWQEAAAAAPSEQPFSLEVPRISAEELRRNRTLRTGHHAFVLKDFTRDRWSATNWTLAYLKDKIPFEWVDYYPNNMVDVGSKPYLYKFADALPRFLEPSGTPKYMQLRLGSRGWRRLKRDFDPKPVPEVFWDDDSWIEKCMRKEDGKVDKEAVDNFFVTQQWKFLLIGETGTSMFFHKDGTAASSWQAQIVGRKQWTLCPNTESHFLDVHLDTYNPDYARFPNFAKAKCGQIVARPGDLLYYPAYWWHHIKNLDTPTIAYTGALVGVEANRDDLGGERRPHARFYSDLMERCAKCWKKGDPKRRCDDISEKWPGAAPPMLRVMCENYLPKCFGDWEAHAASLHHSGKDEL